MGGSLLGLGGYGSESGSDSDDHGNENRAGDISVKQSNKSNNDATTNGPTSTSSSSNNTTNLPPLLDGWQECVDEHSGGTYYWQTETGKQIGL